MERMTDGRRRWPIILASVSAIAIVALASLLLLKGLLIEKELASLHREKTGEYGSYFTGPVQVEWPVGEERGMRLLRPFGFLDAENGPFLVQSGATIDGASIPPWAWSFVGGPFEQNYREASVIHDFYCDTKIKPWKVVHLVFYKAMRVSGVEEGRAAVMWAAVRYFGPRWRTLDHSGNCLDSCDETYPTPARYNADWFRAYVDWIERDSWNLPIEDLERLAAACDGRSKPSEVTLDKARKEFGVQWAKLAEESFQKLGCPPV